MRKKIPTDNKRQKIIGIKTTEEVKKQIEFISDREGRTVSSHLNYLLTSYISDYFKKNKIKWEEFK